MLAFLKQQRRALFQPRACSSPGHFPAPGLFQPRAFSSQGLVPARGIVQQRVCEKYSGHVLCSEFSSGSLMPARAVSNEVSFPPLGSSLVVVMSMFCVQ